MLYVVILCMKSYTYSFKSTQNDGVIEDLYMTILFILRVFTRKLLRGSRQTFAKNISFAFDIRFVYFEFP